MKRPLAVLFALLFALSTFAQTPDRDLLTEINRIKAIDNHAHPLAFSMPGDPSDEEFDAISCGGLEFISPPPMRLRFDNPIYTGAWRELFDYQHGEDMSRARVEELVAKKRRVMREQGDNYPTWVLDRLNIEIMLANRPSPGRGLARPRFRWVGYVDALMLPLKTNSLRVDSDKKFFYGREEILLKRHLAALGVKELPATLDRYLATIVKPTLVRLKSVDAIAIKFVAAYMRPLEFDAVPQAQAARVYARYVRAGEPTWRENKQLQDFLFRYIAREAGRLGLPVHIHTGGGCGHYFKLTNGDPLLLESVVNDPSLRATEFVLVHGGYPFVKETAFLLEKPNVYADFSAQTFLLTPHALAAVIRQWIEYEPEKVLFATDASPGPPEVSWEESAWLTNRTAREALAIALTGMMRDGYITADRAGELARMVLRNNALRLYKLK